MARRRVLILGTGLISRFHQQAVETSDRLELAGRIPFRTGDWRAALARADADFLVVATASGAHDEAVFAAAERRIPVLVEKPLAITVNEAKQMIRKSEETGKLLGVCFQNRLNRASVEAKEILDSGKYGRILSGMALVTWYRNGKYYSESPWRGKYAGEGGGCIINQSIHTLDLVDYLTGGVEALAGFDGKLRDTDAYEVEDTAMALMRLKCGAEVVAFCTNCYLGSKVCDVELRLEHAVMQVRQSGLTIVEEDGNTIFHPAEVLTGEKSEWGVSHGILINEFYKSLVNGTPFIADCHTGLAAVSIVNAIQHSKGRYIKIER